MRAKWDDLFAFELLPPTPGHFVWLSKERGCWRSNAEGTENKGERQGQALTTKGAQIAERNFGSGGGCGRREVGSRRGWRAIFMA